MALSAYRHLLRATRIAFQGDFHLLHAARTQARTGFDSLRSLEPDSEEAVKGIAHAEGVASVLRHNIVQGKRREDSDVIRMGTAENDEHKTGVLTAVLELNIHEHTERGDNDTVKHPLGKDGKVKIGGL